ncbi:MAG: uroporphyrinogen decarboxylase family protein [Candidatus Bathyarchaeia archaeon]|jgi:uroporphyrinogen decarboxylase
MNSKDRVLKALAFQKSDRIPVVPFIITFAAKYGGFRFIEYATNTSILAQCQIAVAKRFKIDAVYVDSDPIIEIEAMGARVRYPEDESPSVLEPTVKSLNDIQSLTLPDPEKDGRLPVWINAIRILKEKVGNEFAVFANINGPFLAAAQLLGMLETAKCMRRSPDVLLELMDLTTQTIVNFMKAEIQAGADAIILGDPMSSSSVISPKEFAQFSFPYIQEVVRQAGEVPIILHICGDTTRIIDKMVETGAKYLELDWSVDLAQVRMNYGNTIGLIGNVNPTLLLTGTPELVEESCRKAIEAAGLTGAYILGTGCELPRETPHTNLDTMIRAAVKYGMYR